jgi:hypothetical protein
MQTTIRRSQNGRTRRFRPVFSGCPLGMDERSRADLAGSTIAAHLFLAPIAGALILRGKGRLITQIDRSQPPPYCGSRLRQRTVNHPCLDWHALQELFMRSLRTIIATGVALCFFSAATVAQERAPASCDELRWSCENVRGEGNCRRYRFNCERQARGPAPAPASCQELRFACRYDPSQCRRYEFNCARSWRSE